MSGSGATTTSHTVSGLTNLTEYTFEVRAVRGSSQGPPSSVGGTPEGPPDPALNTGGLYAYWTDSAGSSDPHPDTNQNRLEIDPCSGTQSFRIIWSNPKGRGAADLWQAQVRTMFGASSVEHTFSSPAPDLPEMNGTVSLEGASPAMSIRVRGRYGDTFGTWSPAARLSCGPPGGL